MAKAKSNTSSSKASKGSNTQPNYGDRVIRGDNPNLPTFKNPPPAPNKKGN